MIYNSIPSPPYNSFLIGSLTIHIYALCILFGIIVGLFFLNFLVKKYKPNLIDFEELLEMICWVLPFSIIGARLFHCLTIPDNYFSSPAKLINILKIWQGGLGIMGGVTFGVITAYIFAVKKSISLVTVLDLAAPCLLVAQAIGRFGNYFNKELYGLPTTLPWGLKIDNSGILYHPTFLYEAIWNCLGAVILYLIIKKTFFKVREIKKQQQLVKWQLVKGTIFNLYIIWYCFGRTFIELIRIDYSYQFYSWRINSLIACIICVLAIICLVVRQKSFLKKSNLASTPTA
ncbi:MAG: prolipoprotein diacylglyceryl transferase [Bifidobacteriaceae bacterium]|jgi:prolipoprotein diacylglyceryl transferase|nr:prolipoprotein diacylglyceryl transferase [Bifidobacteriaceae bacterium]